MNKDDFLKHVAETGYNVGYGAKKSFSTYDIVEKAPGLISFISTAIGVFALIIDGLSEKPLSAALVVMGISGLYISFYDRDKTKYENAGVQLTRLFNDLKVLYYSVKSDQASVVSAEKISQLKMIEEGYYSASLSKQILFSDWYAHYKFFWQHQIDWIDEQKKFRFLRDKVPLSMSITVVVLCGVLGVALVRSLAC